MPPTSAPRFALDPDHLTTHASTLEQRLATAADQAAAAIRQVRLDSGAYGQLCAFVPAWLSERQSTLEAAGRDSAEALRGVAHRLRLLATAHERGEAAAIAALDGLRERQPPT